MSKSICIHYVLLCSFFLANQLTEFWFSLKLETEVKVQMEKYQEYAKNIIQILSEDNECLI